MVSLCSTAQHAIQFCDTPVDWSATGDFWSPIMTLVAGGAAVAGAIYVAKRQNQILAQQTRLQELTYRSELFDRQTAVYLTMRQYMAIVIAMKTSNQNAIEEWAEYREAYETARFIFSKKLFLEISAIDEQIEATRKALRYAEWKGHDEADAEIAWSEYERKKTELRRHYMRMPTMFDQEINLRYSIERVDDYYTDEQRPEAVNEIGLLAMAEEGPGFLSRLRLSFLRGRSK